jgi:hypothetical protein
MTSLASVRFIFHQLAGVHYPVALGRPLVERLQYGREFRRVVGSVAKSERAPISHLPYRLRSLHCLGMKVRFDRLGKAPHRSREIHGSQHEPWVLPRDPIEDRSFRKYAGQARQQSRFSSSSVGFSKTGSSARADDFPVSDVPVTRTLRMST